MPAAFSRDAASRRRQAIVVKSDVTGPVRKTATLLQHVRNVFTQVPWGLSHECAVCGWHFGQLEWQDWCSGLTSR